MEALIKTDAYGKQHRVYRISDFDHTAFQRDLTTIFLIHAYVDTEFKYLVIEKVRYDGGKRCVYRTVPIHDMDGRVIHGFYAESATPLLASLLYEFVAKVTGMSRDDMWFLGYARIYQLPKLIAEFPNTTSEELIAMAKQL
jgi:hypothetical protein